MITGISHFNTGFINFQILTVMQTPSEWQVTEVHRWNNEPQTRTRITFEAWKDHLIFPAFTITLLLLLLLHVLVVFQFYTLDLQSDRDYVRVHDGRSSSSRRLVKLNGKNQPTVLMSTGRYIKLIFYSAALKYAGKGFRASYFSGMCSHIFFKKHCLFVS